MTCSINRQSFRSRHSATRRGWPLSREKATFTSLRKALKLTPGNLEFHLKALEEAGIVRTYYGFGKRPRKFVEITEEGIGELKEVLKILKDVAGD